ncbi:hypothetical protein BC830DRAFT_1090432 [Chytriomyces sp. MP71]|nr:hypothetical protein BC830DRAFT_1090432 [Chytriomyces sp. MP71]
MSRVSISSGTASPPQGTAVIVYSLGRPKTVTRHSSPPKPHLTTSFINLLKPFTVSRNQSDMTIAHGGSAEVVQGFRVSPKVPAPPEEQEKTNAKAKIAISQCSLKTVSLESAPETAPIGPPIREDVTRLAPPFPVRRRNTMDVPSFKRTTEITPNREEKPKSLLNLASCGSRSSIEKKLRVSSGELGTVLSRVGNRWEVFFNVPKFTLTLFGGNLTAETTS